MAIFEDPQGVLHRQDFFDFLIVDEKHGISALCFCYHNEPKLSLGSRNAICEFLVFAPRLALQRPIRRARPPLTSALRR